MVLPLYLAMTAGETAAASRLPPNWCYMACHFSPEGPGLRDLPEELPPEALLILNDRFPCRNHDPKRIAAELGRLCRGGVLLDFERMPREDAIAVARALFETLPCPVAAPPGFIDDRSSPVFLSPCPLHVPLAEYLEPWRGREIWLETAPLRQTLTVTAQGTAYGPVQPGLSRQGGFFDEILLCRCVTEISDSEVRFTLFDTPDTLLQKLEAAAALGVRRAIGLWKELESLENIQNNVAFSRNSC